MKLEQSFEVDAPLERVWQTLIDVENVAPCLPGAAVTGRNEDGSYNGTFTVKIGPTTASYTGRLEMENIDEGSHTATMQAQGTDKRGQGGAKATIHSKLAPADGSGTRVEVVTDYHITGRLARFGRGGMIEDISERLLREFAKRLQSSLASQPEVHAVSPTEEAPAVEAVSPTEEAPAVEAVSPIEEATAPEPVSPIEAAPAGYSEAAPAMGYAGEGQPPEAPVSPAAEAPASEESLSPEPSTPPEAPGWESAEPSTPPEAPVSPAGDVAPPPPPSDGEPAVVPAPADPASGPAPAADVGQPAGPGAEPAPPPPPSPGPPPVAPSPPPPPPPPPGAQERPGLQHPPEPSEPMQGLSLVGGVVWNRVKRNPAPAAAAGVAVMLLLARRRRRRNAWR